jgi:hypothetical protein
MDVKCRLKLPWRLALWRMEVHWREKTGAGAGAGGSMEFHPANWGEALGGQSSD